MTDQMIVGAKSGTANRAKMQVIGRISVMNNAVPDQIASVREAQMAPVALEEMGHVDRHLFRRFDDLRRLDRWLGRLLSQRPLGQPEHVDHLSRADVTLLVVLQTLIGDELGLALAALEELFIVAADVFQEVLFR